MTNLPDCAAAKLRALETAALDARALAVSTAAEIERLNVDLGNMGQQQRFHAGQDDQAGVRRIADEIATLERARDAAVAQRLLRQDRAALAQRVLTTVKDWLAMLRPGRVLEPVAVPAVKLKGAETAQGMLAIVRSEILDLQRERASIEHAALPIEDLWDQVRERVRKMAERGRPHVAVLGGDLVIDFQRVGSDGRRSIEDILAWMHPATMLRAIEGEVETMLAARLGTGEPVMNADERRTRLGEIKRELDTLERREEALVVMCIAAGVAADRRIDASPACVLGVRVTKMAAKIAA